MRSFVCLFLIATHLVSHRDLSAEIPALDSRIESVRVYQMLARVTRTVRIPESTVDTTLRITGLPSSMQLDSIGWQADEGMAIESVRVLETTNVQQDTATEAIPPEVRSQQQAVAKALQSVAVIEQDLQTLENMVDFATIKAHGDVQRSELKVASVTELVDFVMKRRRSLADELLQARENLTNEQSRQKQLVKELESLNSQPAEPLFYDAVISTRAGKGGTLRFSYWVDGVTWTPHYTLRATTSADQPARLSLRLDGMLEQDSGEDWHEAAMAFCTGFAGNDTSAPSLLPFRVSTQAISDEKERLPQSIMGGLAGNSSDTPFGHSIGNTNSMPQWQDPVSWQQDLNRNATAATRQVAELNRAQGVQRTIAIDAGDNVNNETYELADSVSVASGVQPQSITLFTIEMEHPIQRVVTPLLSSFAYRQAELTNPLGKTLIGAAATVILDGHHVGRTTLPPTAANGKLVVGLGPDRQVRTRRELLSRKDSLQGGNRVSQFRYRLVVSNYHSEPVAIQLNDRLPTSDDTGTINVTLDNESQRQLSDDARYLRMQHPIGILRWDLDVPGDRFGAEAFDHHYEYTVETDRNHQIVGITQRNRLQDDLRFNGTGGGGFGGGMGGGGMGGGGMGGGGGQF